MAWPVTVFDAVVFTEGEGYDEVVAIHLAIKERADAVLHSLADGDYADEWTEPRIWTTAPDGVETRTYLQDVLEKFYADITDLVEGEAGIRWTHEAAGGSTEWSMASLVTDIGMGAFADLVTNAAGYEAFQWLHECLNRLLYSYKAATTATVNWSSKADSSSADLQTAWGLTISAGAITTTSWGIIALFYLGYGNKVHWAAQATTFGMSLSYSCEICSETVTNDWVIPDAGTPFTATAYKVRGQNHSDIDIACSFGSASWTLPDGTDAATVWRDTATADLTPGETNTISMEITTSVPATVPFTLSGAEEKVAIFSLAEVRGILDLTAILTDQAA